MFIDWNKDKLPMRTAVVKRFVIWRHAHLQRRRSRNVSPHCENENKLMVQWITNRFE